MPGSKTAVFMGIFMLAVASVTWQKAYANCVSASIKMSVYGIDEGMEPDQSDVKKVKEKAMTAAWNIYVERLPANYLKAYTKDKNRILSELKFYISEQEFKWTYDESEEEIKGTNCIYVNFDRLKTALKVEPEAPVIQSGEGSLFVTLFVARQALNAKTFDAIRQSEASATASQSSKTNSRKKSKSAAKEKADASGGMAISIAKQKSASKSKASSSETVSGSNRSTGSTERRSDEIQYKIISGEPADGAMSEPLADAGYESAVYDDVAEACGGISAEKLSEAFKTKNKLTGRQRGSAFKAARECEAKYFALGTMTAEIARNYRGRKLVIVRVQGSVFNLQRRVPRRVVAMSVKQYKGLGPSEDSARTNALKLAGLKAGEMITEALQKKGLR